MLKLLTLTVASIVPSSVLRCARCAQFPDVGALHAGLRSQQDGRNAVAGLVHYISLHITTFILFQLRWEARSQKTTTMARLT